MAALSSESRCPPPNRAASGTLGGRLIFVIRRLLDLQLHTIIRDVTPWLTSRTGNVLDVGCGDQPFRHLLPKNCRYRGLDWEESKTYFSITETADNDISYYNGDNFPFPDHSFESLFHTEVLEHVKDVTSFLKECQRVLKPGGEMMLTVPFQARYHYIPFDYWRFTPSGLRAILEASGFSDIDIISRGTDITVAAYKALSVFYRFGATSLLGKVWCAFFIWFIIILLMIAHLSLLFEWGSRDDCLGYTVKAKC